MPFEYRTKFSPLFRPPFDYQTGIQMVVWIPNYHLNTGHLNTGQVKVHYSDVCYLDPHCSPNAGIFLKLFQKWRRRWFVLEQGKLPGQYLLCYYTDEQKKRLKGTICLDECDQVCHVLCDLRSSLRFQSVTISWPEVRSHWEL